MVAVLACIVLAVQHARGPSSELQDSLGSSKLPVFGAVVLCAAVLLALQLLPLPVQMPLPSMAAWRRLPGRSMGAISLDPASTQISLALLILYGVVWWCCYRLGATSKQRQILFRVVLLNGVLITIFAVVQKLTWNGKLYWYFPLGPNTTFGPMVYHNISGAWLTFAFSAGLYVLLLGRERRTGVLESGTLIDLTLVSVVLVGLLGSLSRGAILSAGIAGLLTMLLAPLKSRLRITGLIAAIGVSVVGLLLWFGIFDSVLKRFAQMSSSYMAEDSRLVHWQSGWQAASDFWATGCGAGAYGRVVSTYEWNPQIFDYAHNQYLETLVTMGVPGTILVLAALCVLARDLLFAARRVRGANQPLPDREDLALFAAGSFFLISQVCHAVVDYCLSIPAIGICFAAMLGLVHARFWPRSSVSAGLELGGAGVENISPRVDFPSSFPTSFSVPDSLKLACSILLLAAIGWATWVSLAAARVDLAMRRLPWDRSLQELGDETLKTCTLELENALRWRPHDAVALEALGNLQVAQYRLAALRQLAAETGVDVNDANLWQWTSPDVLHHRACQLSAANRLSDLAEVRSQTPVADHLVPALRAYLRSWQSCPLMPEVLINLETLGFLQSELAPANEGFPKKPTVLARSMSGSNPEIHFRCGKLDFSAGRLDAAVVSWRASLSASPRFLPDIVAFASQFADPPKFIDGVVPEDRTVVMRLMSDARYEQIDSQVLLAKANKVAEMLAAGPMQADDLVFVALVKSRQQQPNAAADLLQRAVQLRPEDVAIRFRLAQALADSQRTDEAIRELLLCIRMRPDNQYRQLLESLRALQQ